MVYSGLFYSPSRRLELELLLSSCGHSSVALCNMWISITQGEGSAYNNFSCSPKIYNSGLRLILSFSRHTWLIYCGEVCSAPSILESSVVLHPVLMEKTYLLHTAGCWWRHVHVHTVELSACIYTIDYSINLNGATVFFSLVRLALQYCLLILDGPINVFIALCGYLLHSDCYGPCHCSDLSVWVLDLFYFLFGLSTLKTAPDSRGMF